MNQFIIGFAQPGKCPVCAGHLKVCARLQAWDLPAILPCPVCVGPEALEAFVSNMADYVSRPAEPPEVIA